MSRRTCCCGVSGSGVASGSHAQNCCQQEFRTWPDDWPAVVFATITNACCPGLNQSVRLKKEVGSAIPQYSFNDITGAPKGCNGFQLPGDPSDTLVVFCNSTSTVNRWLISINLTCGTDDRINHTPFLISCRPLHLIARGFEICDDFLHFGCDGTIDIEVTE